MMSETTKRLGRGLILFAGLVVLLVFYDHHDPFVSSISKALKTFIVFLISWVVYRIVMHKMQDFYGATQRGHIPHFLVRLIQFFVFMGMILTVVLYIFQQPIFSFLALGSLLGAGAMFGLGPLILDAFSGIAHQAEGAFDIGDWIRMESNNDAGEVTHISWRCIFLRTIDGYNIVVPHRKLSEGFDNYSRPRPNFLHFIEVKMPHQVPVDRMRRIASSALDQLPVIEKNEYNIFAEKVTEGGIVYRIEYMIRNYPSHQEARHQVIAALTKTLRDYGLYPSESIGEYRLSNTNNFTDELNPLMPLNIFKKNAFFSCLSTQNLEELCQSVSYQTFKKGDKIIEQGQQGDSLFLIAEGVVDVQIDSGKGSLSVARLSKGQHFGEMSLLTGEPRSASVIADTDVIVYEISKHDLAPILKSDKTLVEKMAHQVEEKRRENLKKIDENAKKTAANEGGLSRMIQAINKWFGL